MRAVDDDNGNLTDGTPHGGAIGAAFNRHGIACTTDTGWNTTFAGVTPPAVPALTVTAGSNSAALSWSGSTGVYDIYRNEAGCSAGFTKAANDVSGTTYNDTAVANGVTYYYQVVAQPSGNEAAASAPSTCRSVTPVAGTCTPPAAPTGVAATSSSQTAASVSWTASSGATSYSISRVDDQRRTVHRGRLLGDEPVLEHRPHLQHDLLLRRLGLERHLLLGQLGAGFRHHRGLHPGRHDAHQRRAGHRHLRRRGEPAELDDGGARGRLQPGLPDLGRHRRRGHVRPLRLGADPDHLRLPAVRLRQRRDLHLRGAGDRHLLRHAERLLGLLGRVAGRQLRATGGGGCTATTEVEANNTRTAPQAISGTCNQISGNFTNDAASNQNDYFRLSLPAGRTVTALLNGLTVDYDLYIYNSTTGSCGGELDGRRHHRRDRDLDQHRRRGVNVYVRVYRYSATKTTYQLKVSY